MIKLEFSDVADFNKAMKRQPDDEALGFIIRQAGMFIQNMAIKTQTNPYLSDMHKLGTWLILNTDDFIKAGGSAAWDAIHVRAKDYMENGK